MNIEATFTFFKILERDYLSFIYLGDFNDDITAKILRLCENNISKIQQGKKVKKKVFVLLVECFQNILQHAHKPDVVHRTNNRPRMFMTRNIGPSFYITSTNLIDNQKVDSLKEKMEDLNKLSPVQLSALYRDLLSDTGPQKGGNRMGLLEMARKSGHKLEYDFEFVNYYLSLFYILLTLRNKMTLPEAHEESGVSIHDSKRVHQLMQDHGILLVHKGDFSQETILPVLGIVESSFDKGEGTGKRKKIIYLLIELLQNISKHARDEGGQHEGILILGRQNEQFVILTGNLIENKEVENLKKQLDTINSLSRDKMSDFFKKKMLSRKHEIQKGGAGLGLIDIGRFSKGKLVYEFKPVDNASHFFSLKTVL